MGGSEFEVETFEGKSEPFESIDKCHSWLHKQETQWRHFRDICNSGQNPDAAKLCSDFEQTFKRLRQIVSGHRGPSGDSAVVKQEVTSALKAGCLTTNCDVVTQFRRVNEQYGSVAAAAVLEFGVPMTQKKGVVGPDNQFARHFGYVMAALTNEKLPTESNYLAIKELHANWDSHFSNLDEEIAALVGKRTQDLHNLEVRYKTVREISEPASYWKGRRNVSRGLAILSILAFAFLLSRGVWELVEYSKGVKTDVLNANPTSGWQVLPHTFPLVLMTAALFWALRILARVFFHQIHVWSGSAERVVMANTYLSLLVGKGVLDGESALPAAKDQELILKSLFAPMESAPPQDASPVDWFRGAKS